MVEEGTSGSSSSATLATSLVLPRVPWAGPLSLGGAEGSALSGLLPMKPVEPVEARADVDPHMGVGTIRSPGLSD